VLKQARWAEAQEARLLPTRHFQIVFTVADTELRPFFRTERFEASSRSAQCGTQV
jgi:hypothetical protein